jgi:NTP pyrophosphatase (non-canonical NTP hydrolase)
MDISQIIKLQSEFDAQHASNTPWNQPISEGNLYLLEHLLVCLVGEVGECANLIKKVVRGDRSYASVRDDLGAELADTFIYLIKICNQTGLNLESEFLKKLELNRTRFKRYEVQSEE